MNSSVCVFSISACLQDKLLCFSVYLRWYIYSSLIACIKMSESLTNPKQQAPFFRHTKILHMLVSMGSTALVAGVVLPRYGGLNYARGIIIIFNLLFFLMSCCIILYNTRVKVLNKSASFTTKCIMVSKRVTENVCLTPALMDDATE